MAQLQRFLETLHVLGYREGDDPDEGKIFKRIEDPHRGRTHIRLGNGEGYPCLYVEFMFDPHGLFVNHAVWESTHDAANPHP